MTSVNRNVFLSALAYWSIHVVRAGQELVWVPLFLSAFGKEGYGEWLTLFGLAGYVVMADLGVQIYWLNLLTGSYVRKDIDGYRRIFRGGLFLLAAVGGIALVLSAVFSALRGPSRVLGLETIGPPTASMVFLVLVGSTLLVVLSQMLRGVFRTVGENPKFVWFGMARESITFALVAGALLLGLGPLGLAWVYGGIGIGIILWVIVTVRRRFPDLVDFRARRADRGTVAGLVGGGSIRLAGVLANLLLVQGTLIITNWALGAAMVALVATCRTLANVAIQVGGGVYNATLPEFSRLEAAGDSEAMRNLLRRSTSFVLLISGLACIALVGIGPWLFDIWTGGRFAYAAPLIYLFAASVVVDSLRMPLHLFLLGCNRIAWTSVPDIVYAVSSLSLMWLLFPRLGPLAVPVATIACGAGLHLPAMVAGTIRILGLRGILGPGRAAVVNLPALGVLAAGLLFSQVLSPSILVTTAFVALAATLYCLCSWFLTFSSADRAAMMESVRLRTRKLRYLISSRD